MSVLVDTLPILQPRRNSSRFVRMQLLGVNLTVAYQLCFGLPMHAQLLRLFVTKLQHTSSQAQQTLLLNCSLLRKLLSVLNAFTLFMPFVFT